MWTELIRNQVERRSRVVTAESISRSSDTSPNHCPVQPRPAPHRNCWRNWQPCLVARGHQPSCGSLSTSLHWRLLQTWWDSTLQPAATNSRPSSTLAWTSTICNSTHTQPFNGPWSGTTQVGRYKKKHAPTHIHPDHRTSFINFLHLLRSIASSLFCLRAWQSFSTTSLQVLFGLPLGLGPSTSYSMHFFTESSSSFRSTCPYHRLFFCNTNAMSSIPNLSLSAPYNSFISTVLRWFLAKCGQSQQDLN